MKERVVELSSTLDGTFRVETPSSPTPPPTWTATERDPDTGEMKKPEKGVSNEPAQ